jgi:hypothetical protein
VDALHEEDVDSEFVEMMQKQQQRLLRVREANMHKQGLLAGIKQNFDKGELIFSTHFMSRIPAGVVTDIREDGMAVTVTPFFGTSDTDASARTAKFIGNSWILLEHSTAVASKLSPILVATATSVQGTEDQNDPKRLVWAALHTYDVSEQSDNNHLFPSNSIVFSPTRQTFYMVHHNIPVRTGEAPTGGKRKVLKTGTRFYPLDDKKSRVFSAMDDFVGFVMPHLPRAPPAVEHFVTFRICS